MRCSSRAEPVAILAGVDEAVDHQSIVARLVHRMYPVDVERVGVSAQLTEVLHDDERLVEEFGVHLGALRDLS